MYLSTPEKEAYLEQGFLFLPARFTPSELATIKNELVAELAQESPARVLESDGRTVRSVYGSHRENPFFQHLTTIPRLLRPAMQILQTDVYVHQFKVNCKAAFSGDIWEWHQDFIFWLKEDAILKQDLVNVAVFLDEVTEFNGPLFLIPCSQREQVIETSALAAKVEQGMTSWVNDLTADLKYSLDQPILARMVRQYGIVAPKGPAGSILLFHPNIVHGSPPNMSPFSRQLLMITYNSTTNIPVALPDMKRRPDFLASRNYQATVPSEDIILAHS